MSENYQNDEILTNFFKIKINKYGFYRSLFSLENKKILKIA